MRRILGALRRADRDFRMIEEGDKIAVGLSGGKDSLVLTAALGLYRRFAPVSFSIVAIHLSLGLSEENVSGLEAFCRERDIPFVLVRTEIGNIVLNERHEKNPCSLCAAMRRGALHDAALEQGCNKVALGHHMDDALETLVMSIYRERRMHTFSPVTYLSRKDITVIRPMVYSFEKEIRHFAEKESFPVLKSPCPMDGHTERENAKAFLREMNAFYPSFKKRLASALIHTDRYGLWDEAHISRRPEAD